MDESTAAADASLASLGSPKRDAREGGLDSPKRDTREGGEK
jgi:hypothetical protein